MLPIDRNLITIWGMWGMVATLGLIDITLNALKVEENPQPTTRTSYIDKSDKLPVRAATNQDKPLSYNSTVFFMGLTQIGDYPISISSYGISQHRRADHGVCQTTVSIRADPTLSNSFVHRRLSTCFTDSGIPRLQSILETTINKPKSGTDNQYYEAAKKLREWQYS